MNIIFSLLKYDKWNAGIGDEPTSLHIHKSKINAETGTANYYFKFMILVNSFSIIPQYFVLVKM